MRAGYVVNACSLALDEDSARIAVNAIIGAWQGGPPPTIEWRSSDDLLESNHDAAIVFAGSHANPHSLLRLMDSARENHGAMLVVSALPPEVARSFEGDGVIAVPASASPDSIAMVLRAMCQRQREVGGLVRELKVAESCQRSAHDEVERIHDELNLAAQIQQEALPHEMPSPEGFEFAALFRPAGYVSGDIYDVSTLPDGRVRFFLADAVGHGVPAALLTMLVSRAMRISGEGGAFSPATALSRLNDELVRAQKGRVRFVTAVCGVLDPTAGRVQIASAGHPPAIVFSNGKARPVEADGPLLGVFGGEEYVHVDVDLPPGSTLLCFSDGFETAFPELEKAGGSHASDAHLGRFAALPWPDESRGGLAPAFGVLRGMLDEHTGSLHQVDDITALAIAAVTRAAREAA